MQNYVILNKKSELNEFKTILLPKMNKNKANYKIVQIVLVVLLFILIIVGPIIGYVLSYTMQGFFIGLAISGILFCTCSMITLFIYNKIFTNKKNQYQNQLEDLTNSYYAHRGFSKEDAQNEIKMSNIIDKPCNVRIRLDNDILLAIANDLVDDFGSIKISTTDIINIFYSVKEMDAAYIKLADDRYLLLCATINNFIENKWSAKEEDLLNVVMDSKNTVNKFEFNFDCFNYKIFEDINCVKAFNLRS